MLRTMTLRSAGRISIPEHLLISRRVVAPTHEWTFDLCQQFCHIERDDTLAIRQGPFGMTGSAKVFQALTITESHSFGSDGSDTPTLDVDVTKHMDSEFLKQHKARTNEWKRDKKKEKEKHQKNTSQQNEERSAIMLKSRANSNLIPNPLILAENKRMVKRLEDALQESSYLRIDDKNPKDVATQFLRLTGFDDDPFTMTSEGKRAAAARCTTSLSRKPVNV
jgi:hypothetical protein